MVVGKAWDLHHTTDEVSLTAAFVRSLAVLCVIQAPLSRGKVATYCVVGLCGIPGYALPSMQLQQL